VICTPTPPYRWLWPEGYFTTIETRYYDQRDAVVARSHTHLFSYGGVRDEHGELRPTGADVKPPRGVLPLTSRCSLRQTARSKLAPSTPRRSSNGRGDDVASSNRRSSSSSSWLGS
jgi:hypothetical protein